MATELLRIVVLLAFAQQALSACRYEGNAPENGYFINAKGVRPSGNVMQQEGGVDIACEEGYYLWGSHVRECVGSGKKKKWAALESECRDINECIIGVYPEDSDESQGSQSSFSFSSFSSHAQPDLEPACHKDAVCRNLEGSYECECKKCFLGDGKKCVADLTPCTTLTENLENGKIYKSRGGKIIEYVCDTDYREVNGVTRRTCECGTWVPNEEIASYCKFAGCEKPADPLKGKVLYSSLLYGNVIIYHCDEGFILKGPSKRECLKTGEWSYYEPTCDPAPTFADVASKFKDSFIDKVGSYSNTSNAGEVLEGRLAANLVGLDIIFAFDASSSIGVTNFKYGVDFAKLLVDEFGVSYEEGGTRIAAVVFANKGKVKFNFMDEKADSAEEVKTKIEEIQQELGGGTAMKEAFEVIIEKVIPKMRPAAKRALFMITDGESNDGNPAAAAKRLRDDEDVEIFAIGVGTQVNRNELKSISNTPYTSHVFLIKSFSDLQILSEVISEKRVDFNRCGVAIDIDIKEAKIKELDRNDPGYYDRKNYDVAVPNSWPWVASISRKFKDSDVFENICGGTLICSQWVLTAASCVNRNSRPLRTNEIMVTFGQHNRSLDDAKVEVQEKYVEEIILADGFVRDEYGKDLALIKLKTPVVLASFVRTACLGDENDVIRSAFDDCYTIGWGARDPTEAYVYPDIPQQMRLPVKSESDCKYSHEGEYGENILCAGTRATDTQACLGDVGGALVCIRHDDTWTIVGVTAPNNQCDQNGKYGVYTKPVGFTEWIQTTTENCLDNHLNIFS